MDCNHQIAESPDCGSPLSKFVFFLTNSEQSVSFLCSSFRGHLYASPASLCSHCMSIEMCALRAGSENLMESVVVLCYFYQGCRLLINLYEQHLKNVDMWISIYSI